eukprot:scaffold198636_cov21-Tisochrysis_lutea.AAC.1
MVKCASVAPFSQITVGGQLKEKRKNKLRVPKGRMHSEDATESVPWRWWRVGTLRGSLGCMRSA